MTFDNGEQGAGQGRRGGEAYRVAFWPVVNDNPYQELFYSALRPHGIQAIPVGGAYAVPVLPAVADAVHLHWPEYAWQVGSRCPVPGLAGLSRLRRLLDDAKKDGRRVIWTAHNVIPHDSHWLNSYGTRMVADRADLVIVHSRRLKEYFTWQLTAPTVFMPHGNYDGCYPPSRPRQTVLREMGLAADVPTVALVGRLRAYKGIDRALAALDILGGHCQLIMAGRPRALRDADMLRREAAKRPWMSVVTRALSTQEFADVVGASSAVLLPYTSATSSGMVLAAWTLGRGVVTSAIECFVELLNQHSGAGLAADASRPEALATSIATYISLAAPMRRDAARAAADCYRWDQCVQPVAEALGHLSRMRA